MVMYVFLGLNGYEINATEDHGANGERC